jgi:hypothetical protein
MDTEISIKQNDIFDELDKAIERFFTAAKDFIVQSYVFENAVETLKTEGAQ